MFAPADVAGSLWLKRSHLLIRRTLRESAHGPKCTGKVIRQDAAGLARTADESRADPADGKNRCTWIGKNAGQRGRRGRSCRLRASSSCVQDDAHRWRFLLDPAKDRIVHSQRCVYGMLGDPLTCHMKPPQRAKVHPIHIATCECIFQISTRSPSAATRQPQARPPCPRCEARKDKALQECGVNADSSIYHQVVGSQFMCQKNCSATHSGTPINALRMCMSLIAGTATNPWTPLSASICTPQPIWRKTAQSH